MRESQYIAQSLRVLFQDILPEKILNFLKAISFFFSFFFFFFFGGGGDIQIIFCYVYVLLTF